MGIYTKTGDKGETATFGGKRVPKYDPQIEAIGAIDEATSFIGFAYQTLTDEYTLALLLRAQHGLYNVMGYLAGAKLQEQELHDLITRIEKEIDAIETSLPKLTRFIIPQGSEASARLHIVRVTIRSAERRLSYFFAQKEEQTAHDLLVQKYINRLSDFFFMLARKFSNEEKIT